MEIRALRPSDDRSAFQSGDEALDRFFHHYAGQNQFRHYLGVTYVVVDAERILGFATVAPRHIEIDDLPERARKKLPRYPVPCFRMGRLACRSDRRGQGIGRLLIGCAVERCLQARKQVAAFALIVDAKDAAAMAFYGHYGFTACTDSQMTLYLPLG